MKLVCPSCASGFLVDAAALGPSGRQVRCGQCGHAWHALPVEEPVEEPAVDTPPADAPAEESSALESPVVETDAEPQAAEPPETPPSEPAPEEAAPKDPLPKLTELDESRRRSRTARRRPRSEPKRQAALGGWALFALVAVALLAGVIFGRQQIIAWAPESELLYALVGLAEEPPLPSLPTIQLRLEDVTSDRRQVNGATALVIEGEIVNPTDEPQDVPPLVATLMDPTGIELKRWTFAAGAQVLPPGGHVAFETSTQNPPAQGNLNLNFVPLQQ